MFRFPSLLLLLLATADTIACNLPTYDRTEFHLRKFDFLDWKDESNFAPLIIDHSPRAMAEPFIRTTLPATAMLNAREEEGLSRLDLDKVDKDEQIVRRN